jgi:hypothetical protein
LESILFSVEDGKIVFTERMNNGVVGCSGGCGYGKYYIELNDVVVGILRNIEDIVKSITKDKLSTATDIAKRRCTCELHLDLSKYISCTGFDAKVYLDYEDENKYEE